MPNARGPTLLVPTYGDSDRKRVLGVLAQRRYRDRKRNAKAANKSDVEQATAMQVDNACPEAQPPILALDFRAVPCEQLNSPQQRKNGGSHSDMQCTFQSTTGPVSAPIVLPLDSGPGHSADTEVQYAQSPAQPTSHQSTSVRPHEPGEDPWESLEETILDEFQSLEASQFTFPDDRSLEVPVLHVMRAGLTVADALHCSDYIWNPGASHIVDVGGLDNLALPANFFPIEAQLLVSHHPLFDILPWPSVRRKLIHTFAMPLPLRPPNAREPLAIVHMAYDIDDDTEGFRIAGENGLDDTAWIVGQRFFDNWWWALDRSIVARSNTVRVARGLPKLTLPTFPAARDEFAYT